MKRKLPDDVSSPEDLRAVILEIHQYARWFAHVAIKKRLHAGAAHQAPELSPAAAALIKEQSGEKPITGESLDKLIADLEAFQDTAPQLHITLAAPAASGLKETLIAWCREHIEPNVLVTFAFDSTLLGGLVVRYRSHIFDWSFRRQILAARGQFPEVLRRV